MLKNLDPILTPDLLWVLRAMGHGDDLVLADANFPSQSIAGAKHLIRLPGVDIPTATRAILSVMPLDSFVPHPVLRMEVVGKPDYLPPVQQEVQREIDRHLYKERHLVEHQIGKLKHFRRVFSRFDKFAKNYLSFIYFASTLIWLR